MSDIIDTNETVRQNLNKTCGNDRSTSVAPILKKLIENAEINSMRSSLKGCRHDNTIKKFASSLFCLVGKASYEMLQSNLGCALPSVSTVQRNISSTTRIKEGEFRFDALCNHLKEWNAPMGVNIQLDDTRILKRIEYDPKTGRFVGFCLPLKEDGLPIVDSFVLDTFEEIADAYKSRTCVSYAHCVVATPVSSVAPSFVLFVIGTDSKYTHKEIIQRWKFIESELHKRNVTVYTNGADGAGPFLKAMMMESNLFKNLRGSNVPATWSFYMMPSLKSKSLNCQDMVHLLAKLRTRLIIPSNIISIGSEVACRGHLTEVFKKFPKAKHGLNHRSIDDKDKQNYSCINLMVKQCVEECLQELSSTVKTKGTVIYLRLMRDLRDSFFDKALSPLRRLYLMWKSIYFLRIWRSWLTEHNLAESAHFITNNAYLCVEINGHMFINLVYNVIIGIFSPDTLRVWMTGSQSCEQLFRILRSMTPTISTMVNFSLQEILEKIHKLQFLSSAESDESIVFPRVKRRLLQLKEEVQATLSVPTIEEITQEVLKAKSDAIEICKSCAINLKSYADRDLVLNVGEIVQDAIANDYEEEDNSTVSDSLNNENYTVPTNDVVTIREDLSQIKVRKSKTNTFPTYETVQESTTVEGTSESSSKMFSLHGKLSKTSPFVLYNDTYIRKTTALYLLQESSSVSSDRLLRVRAQQPNHIFSGLEVDKCGPMQCVRAGDLCVFIRIDCAEKCLVGRIIQFSYMQGNKRERQYSADFVDLTKATYKNIGVFANWFQGTRISQDRRVDVVEFKPLELIFTPGYISLTHYIASIDDSTMIESSDNSFSLPIDVVRKVLPQWKTKLTFDL